MTMKTREIRLCCICFLLASICRVSPAADSVVDLLTRAQAAQRGSRIDEAIALAGKAVALKPDNMQAVFVRASIFESARQFDKAIADYDRMIELRPDTAWIYNRRGMAHFRAAHIAASITDFDKAITLKPRQAAHHWQRGISYYYARRYKDGRKQFELHQTVNDNDVENAAWHYLCVARAEGIEKARAALISIKPDRRAWAPAVHALYKGKSTPDKVLAAAKKGDAQPKRIKQRVFYAHLYIGLYHEAAGDEKLARKHLTLAAQKYAGNGYMDDVARVHVQLWRERDAKAAKKQKPAD
jgi:lipoprotein NlpI